MPFRFRIIVFIDDFISIFILYTELFVSKLFIIFAKEEVEPDRIS